MRGQNQNKSTLIFFTGGGRKGRSEITTRAPRPPKTLGCPDKTWTFDPFWPDDEIIDSVYSWQECGKDN